MTEEKDLKQKVYFTKYFATIAIIVSLQGLAALAVVIMFIIRIETFLDDVLWFNVVVSTLVCFGFILSEKGNFKLNPKKNILLVLIALIPYYMLYMYTGNFS